MNYVPSHLRCNLTKKDPIETATHIDNETKIKTNTPYPPLDSLSALSCAKSLPFSIPTLIQKYTIPALLCNHPVLCRAPTGMGKTLCYLLPLVERIRYNQRGVQICVISPIRELCDQIKLEAVKISKPKDLRVESVYGSKNFLSSYKNTDIIIATPGRLLDFLNTKKIDFDNLDYFILDEADKLLEMGFEKEIRSIKGFIKPGTHVSLFSATYHHNLTSIINDFLPADRCVVEIENETVSNISQTIFNLKTSDRKDEKLKEILAGLNFSENWKRKEVPDKVLIFVERKSSTTELEQKITAMGYRCISISGDKEQIERSAALAKFKGGVIPIMIATSVAARGIDIKDIKLVVNYNFPKDIKEYIHRIGRTGREGKPGKAITFIDVDSMTPEAKKELVDVLKESNNEVPKFLTGNFRNSKVSKGRGKFDSKAQTGSGKSEMKIEEAVAGMSVSKTQNLEEKQDSDDDVPCDW